MFIFLKLICLFYLFIFLRKEHSFSTNSITTIKEKLKYHPGEDVTPVTACAGTNAMNV